ncbi:MAG: signal peptidase I [Chloroflexota bacterium]|nr:signal peptidase I [Chloroflexota bacterium]
MKMMVREITITVLLALLIFMGIRAVVHNFEVNGNSMLPNLQNGQFIIVSKAAYWFDEPQRGDIVVFDTSRLSYGIIHRIVGLPGETIEIRKGNLYINGTKTDEPYIQKNSRSESLEKIPDGHYFIVGDNRQTSSADIVPGEDIVGKAWLRYWPVGDWGLAPNYSWESEIADDGVELVLGASALP